MLPVAQDKPQDGRRPRRVIFDAVDRVFLASPPLFEPRVLRRDCARVAPFDEMALAARSFGVVGRDDIAVVVPVRVRFLFAEPPDRSPCIFHSFLRCRRGKRPGFTVKPTKCPLARDRAYYRCNFCNTCNCNYKITPSHPHKTRAERMKNFPPKRLTAITFFIARCAGI